MVTYYGKDNVNDVMMGKNPSTIEIFYGRSGSDRIYGHGGRDFIYGEENDDYLFGGDGIDYLFGGDGTDYLFGGRDGDFDGMYGGKGNDTYLVFDANDYVSEASAHGRIDQGGTDQVWSFRRDYNLPSINGREGKVENLVLREFYAKNGTGNELGNRIVGNNQDNIIDGKGGRDILTGGGGNDTIIGGADDDILNGAGSMRFGHGRSVYGGYSTGAGERDTLVSDRHGGDSDLFVLGEGGNAFYSAQGNRDYALIQNFDYYSFAGEKKVDKIRLHGRASSYSLGSVSVDGHRGTGIYYQNDLIGVVENVSTSNLNLYDTSQFVYG